MRQFGGVTLNDFSFESSDVCEKNASETRVSNSKGEGSGLRRCPLHRVGTVPRPALEPKSQGEAGGSRVDVRCMGLVGRDGKPRDSLRDASLRANGCT